jgi:hypothetical protein
VRAGVLFLVVKMTSGPGALTWPLGPQGSGSALLAWVPIAAPKVYPEAVKQKQKYYKLVNFIENKIPIRKMQMAYQNAQ